MLRRAQAFLEAFRCSPFAAPQNIMAFLQPFRCRWHSCWAHYPIARKLLHSEVTRFASAVAWFAMSPTSAAVYENLSACHFLLETFVLALFMAVSSFNFSFALFLMASGSLLNPV